MRSKLSLLLIFVLFFFACSSSEQMTLGDADSPDTDIESEANICGELARLDSDNDSILDVHEGQDDPDGDSIPNSLDPDSDNDGISDAIEAGREDCDEEPVDTDEDGVPDFLDEDSDDDGLPDAEEAAEGCSENDESDFRDCDSDNDGLLDVFEMLQFSNPCEADTDGDGFIDTMEYAMGTDPLDYSEILNGPLVVLTEDEPEATVETDFEIYLRQADLYLLVDSTASMSDKLDPLIDGFRKRLTPETSDIIRDFQFGTGRFQDIPSGSFGEDSDRPYVHIHDISGDIDSVHYSLSKISFEYGGDEPDSDVIALYCTATGDGVSTWVNPGPTCLFEEMYGYPCFRPMSLPIILLFTDSRFHNGPPDGLRDPYGLEEIPTWPNTLEALRRIGARVLGFSFGTSTDDLSYQDLDATARMTQTIRDDGTPIVQLIEPENRDVITPVIDSINDIAYETRWDITHSTADPQIHDGYDSTRLLASIRPVAADPPEGIEGMDENSFYGVLPSTVLTYELTLRNTLVGPSNAPELFVLTIFLLGDGIVRMSSNQVFVFISPSADCPGFEG